MWGDSPGWVVVDVSDGVGKKLNGDGEGGDRLRKTCSAPSTQVAARSRVV